MQGSHDNNVPLISLLALTTLMTLLCYILPDKPGQEVFLLQLHFAHDDMSSLPWIPNNLQLPHLTKIVETSIVVSHFVMASALPPARCNARREISSDALEVQHVNDTPPLNPQFYSAQFYFCPLD